MGYPDGPSDYAFGAGDSVNVRDPMGLCLGINNIPCFDTVKSLAGWTVGTGESLLKLGFSMPLAAYDGIRIGIDSARRLGEAYGEGGLKQTFKISKQLGDEQQTRSKEQLLGLIPGVNTYRHASQIEAICLTEGAFQCGRKIGNTTVSLGTDVAVVYGGAKAVQARRAVGSPAGGPSYNWEVINGIDELAGVYAEGLAPRAIPTPYGPAFQGISVAALAARGQVQAGATIYKVGTIGRSGAAEAQFWALEHPSAPGFASRYGIPPENVQNLNFIEAGTLRTGSAFVTRVAPPVGSNVGGGIEIVVPECG